MFSSVYHTFAGTFTVGHHLTTDALIFNNGVQCSVLLTIVFIQTVNCINKILNLHFYSLYFHTFNNVLSVAKNLDFNISLDYVYGQQTLDMNLRHHLCNVILHNNSGGQQYHNCTHLVSFWYFPYKHQGSPFLQKSFLGFIYHTFRKWTTLYKCPASSGVQRETRRPPTKHWHNLPQEKQWQQHHLLGIQSQDWAWIWWHVVQWTAFGRPPIQRILRFLFLFSFKHVCSGAGGQ